MKTETKSVLTKSDKRFIRLIETGSTAIIEDKKLLKELAKH